MKPFEVKEPFPLPNPQSAERSSHTWELLQGQRTQKKTQPAAHSEVIIQETGEKCRLQDQTESHNQRQQSRAQDLPSTETPARTSRNPFMNGSAGWAGRAGGCSCVQVNHLLAEFFLARPGWICCSVTEQSRAPVLPSLALSCPDPCACVTLQSDSRSTSPLQSTPDCAKVHEPEAEKIPSS